MYQKMLVPLDGSELAEVVFPYIKELAGRLDVNVVLLHVSTPALNELAAMRHAYVEQAAETVRRQVQEVQQKTGGAKVIKVEGKSVTGYPAEEILRYIDENGIDLILMATHGRSGAKRWPLGNVADKVLRAAKVPSLIVRPETPETTPYDQWPRKTIIAPLDGSARAESVLPHVEALAKQRGTEPVEVALLRVCEPPTIPSYYSPELAELPLNWGAYEQQEIAKGKQAATKYLAGVEKRLKDSGVAKIRSEMLVGKAAEVIVDYVNKTPFGLIVMATHGRSGLSRWVYGSVAENVLQAVSSPLLMIRPS